MTKPYKKKLIEVAIPLEAINAASGYEKMPGIGPHPRGIHHWWARRPLAACRAVLFAQLVDDPSEYVDELLNKAELRKEAERELNERQVMRKRVKENGMAIPADDKPITLEEVIVELERQRLFKIIEDLVKWENSTKEEVLERARAEIQRTCGNELPPIYDPFSGGGSIPLEAQRLGLRAFGSDLNPVAVLIGKAMIEIPPKFKDQPPVHPGSKERMHYRNADGLAEDVRYYGKWIREKAWEWIGHLYPEVDLPKEYGNGKTSIVAWIWSRTVPSPDPAFSDLMVPISSTFLLSSKKGQEAWIEPFVDNERKTVNYTVRYGGSEKELEQAKKGTKAGRGSNFTCLASGAAITMDYVRSCAKSGKMGLVMTALVCKGKGKRIYLSAPSKHQEIAFSGSAQWRPEIRLSSNKRAFTPPDYGMESFGDIYTERQLIALGALSSLIPDAFEKITKDFASQGRIKEAMASTSVNASASEYAKAISLYLAFAVDRCADFNNSLTRWNPSNQKIMNLFGRQVIPIVWDFGEANILENVVGGFLPAVEYISKCMAFLEPITPGSVIQSDAQKAKYPTGCVISTDPPYYDNIPYADLSDLFYSWIKRSLRGMFPNLLSTLAAPKQEELIADPFRHGSSEDAENFFLSGMSEAISKMCDASSDDYPAAIYYAFKQSEILQDGISSKGWATFLEAVIRAGYSINGTWPIRSEQTYRMRAAGSNALANSVVLVCRKRPMAAGSITRAEFIRALKRELPPAIAELQAANIAPADMPQSAIGPGMGVFSRYKAVLEADDSPMTVKAALQLINRELDEFLNDVQGEFDADTRFAITWFEQNGMASGSYGVADNLARARGISVESVKHAGIVESGANLVRILRRDELLDDWDPANDAHMTVWECCQYLIRALETDGEYEAAVLLKKIGPDKADAVKDLAYCLYDICSNKRKDAKEATSYNALIAVWSELTRQAASIHDIDIGGDRQTRMNI